MKTIVFGDTHGRGLWKQIVEKEKPNRVIFIGDYFDSYDIDPATQINNFLDICAYKRANPETILLIGNHDHHYFPEIGEQGIGGYNKEASYIIGHAISGNRDLLQMAYQMENGEDIILFTHAGVSEVWLDMSYDSWKGLQDYSILAQTVNNLWKYEPDSFLFNGRDPYGNNIYQTPIWIRPESLMKANFNMPIKKKIIQVVGHTQMKEIDIKGKSTGGRYYFIDTIGVGQYLIIEDNEFKLGKVNEPK